MHTQTSLTTFCSLLAVIRQGRFLSHPSSWEIHITVATEKSCEKWLLSVPRLHLLLSTSPRKVVTGLIYSERPPKSVRVTEAAHALQVCKPGKHPKNLTGNRVTLSKTSESLWCADAEISAGSPRMSLRGPTSVERGQLCQLGQSFTSACLLPDGCLADTVFQGVDLAKCLMGTPVWGGIAPSLSPRQRCPGNTVVARTDPAVGVKETTPIRRRVCFVGIISAQTRLHAQSIVQGLLYQPSVNLPLSWEKSRGPGQQTVC